MKICLELAVLILCAHAPISVYCQEVNKEKESEIVEIGTFAVEYLPLHPACIDSGTTYSEWSSCNVNFIKEFIRHHLVWPDKGSCFEGTVVYKLKINSNGEIEGIQFMRGITTFADSEAKRVIDLLIENVGLWYIVNKKQLEKEYDLYIPIRFKLE